MNAAIKIRSFIRGGLDGLKKWWDEYQIFAAIVGLLIGVHFVGETLKDFLDLVWLRTGGDGTELCRILKSGLMNAALGILPCWWLIAKLNNKLDDFKCRKAKPSNSSDQDKRSWQDRLAQFVIRKPLRTVTFSVLLLLLVEWSIHALELLLHGNLSLQLLWLVGLVLAVYILAPAAHGLTFVRIQEEEFLPRKFLILFLSYNDGETIPSQNGINVLQYQRFEDDYYQLRKYCDGKGKQWNWEPCLRGIERQMAELERLYLIVSPKSKSKEQVGVFCWHIASYQNKGTLKNKNGKNLEVFVVGDTSAKPVPITFPEDSSTLPTVPDDLSGIDFEDYEQIEEAVKKAVDHADNKKETVIDITGGQKPNSLVGGILTLDNDLIVQYIQTGPEKKAKFYHIVRGPKLVL
ncbi:MAG: hypothetical protein PHE55_01280 [Methylococcaceae bacterium]|nr:hypothetical protein [Methylococcaceae bacterium]